MTQQERLTPKGTLGFLRRLGPRVILYRASLLVAGVLMFFSVGIGLAFPLIVRELLDAAFLAGDSALLNRIAIGLLSLFLLLAVINFFQSYLTASVSEKVVADLRRDLFAGLVYQPPGFFANRRVGELSSRLAMSVGGEGVDSALVPWTRKMPTSMPRASIMGGTMMQTIKEKSRGSAARLSSAGGQASGPGKPPHLRARVTR